MWSAYFIWSVRGATTEMKMSHDTAQTWNTKRLRSLEIGKDVYL